MDHGDPIHAKSWLKEAKNQLENENNDFGASVSKAEIYATLSLAKAQIEVEKAKKVLLEIQTKSKNYEENKAIEHVINSGLNKRKNKSFANDAIIKHLWVSSNV